MEDTEITAQMIDAGVAYARSQLDDLPIPFSDGFLRLLVVGVLEEAFRRANPPPSPSLPQAHTE